MARGRWALACAMIALVVAASPVAAATGNQRTFGAGYDRNPSVVKAGANWYLFYTRSQDPCNRLDGCNADFQLYDIWLKISHDRGATFSPAVLVAANPEELGSFFGRTVAATRMADGRLLVFWASGLDSSRLYYIQRQPAGGPFSLPEQVPGTADDVVNVEALASGSDVYVYTDRCATAGDVVARRYGIVADQLALEAGPTLVAAGGRCIPKGIIDQDGIVRLTYVDLTAYPTVDVLVNSSANGLDFAAERRAVTTVDVSNWDPQLGQRRDGRYYLFYAPDFEQGAGRQRIALKVSDDFVHWSAERLITPAIQDGTEYWDYWPEAMRKGAHIVLYFTSERGGVNPVGLGHIWSLNRR